MKIYSNLKALFSVVGVISIAVMSGTASAMDILGYEVPIQSVKLSREIGQPFVHEQPKVLMGNYL